MRRFVVVGHRAVTSGDFKLDDMPGGAGRLDILARSVNSAFFLSHDMRRNTEAWLVLLGEPDPPRTIRLVGNELRYLNPDERNIGALLRNALMREGVGKRWVRSTPGIYVSRHSFEEVLDMVGRDSQLVYLKEDGGDASGLDGSCEYSFIMGDNADLTEEEEKALLAHGPRTVNLGPLSLHTDHCIIVAHNILDRKV